MLFAVRRGTMAALLLSLVVCGTASAADRPPEIVRAKVDLFAKGERVEFRVVADGADKVAVRYRGERFELTNDASRCEVGFPPGPAGPCNRYVGGGSARGECYRFTVIAKSQAGRDERRFRRCASQS